MFNLLKGLKATTVTALSTTAAKVLDYDNNRGRAIVQNLDASIAVTLGTSSAVTAGSTSGIVLAAGESFAFYGRTPLYAISASGTPNLGITIETTVANEAKVTTITPVALSTTATRVSLRNSSKIRTTIANAHASIVMWVGNSAVAANAGISLAAGQKVTLEGIDAVYVVAASGTPTATIIETKRA